MKKPFCEHVHIVCRELQPMIDFWVEGLGATFEEYRSFRGADGAVLDFNSATKLKLRVVPSQTPILRTEDEHLGVMVHSLDATLAAITAMPGCSVAIAPFIAGSRRCAFVSGPEGVLVEVMEEAG